jgi:hypothetical protein
MSEQPEESPSGEPTNLPDPDRGPDPIDPDLPTGTGPTNDDADTEDATAAGAADTASLGSPRENEDIANQGQ